MLPQQTASERANQQIDFIMIDKSDKIDNWLKLPQRVSIDFYRSIKLNLNLAIDIDLSNGFPTSNGFATQGLLFQGPGWQICLCVLSISTEAGLQESRFWAGGWYFSPHDIHSIEILVVHDDHL